MPTLLALIAAPMGIFGRREKDDWLGELDSIRDDASGLDAEVGTVTASPPDGAGGAGSPVPEQPPAEPSPLAATFASPDTDRVDGTVVQAGRAPRPAPNRERPSELWHAPLDLGSSMSPEIASEERVVSSELADPAPDGDHHGFAPFESEPPHALLLESSADLSVDRLSDPPVDVVAARDLQDGGGAPDRGDQSDATRPRLRPPTDIFDVAATVAPEAEPLATPALPPVLLRSTPTLRQPAGGLDSGSDQARLVGGPVGRRPSRPTTSRSLFGGGVGLPSSQRPEDELVEINDSGEVVDDRGTIRVSERIRPEIVRSATDDSLTVDSGWCWVFRANAVPPARIALPEGTLVVPGATRALAVVEADGSSFISVVVGTAHLEHPTGLVPLPTGSIAHLAPSGSVTVDSASADEMAADAILTRNLQMDDALDAIIGRQRMTSAE